MNYIRSFISLKEQRHLYCESASQRDIKEGVCMFRQSKDLLCVPTEPGSGDPEEDRA